MISVTGCIAAVRRELFATLPPGTILDDVYWPLVLAMRGHRVIHEERATAFDCLPERTGDEFRRKVRTLAGNFQLMARLPAVLLPWRNRSLLAVRLPQGTATGRPPGPCWSFWAAMPYWRAPSTDWLSGAQVAFLGLGLAGTRKAIARRSRLAAAICSFLVLNAAAWVAFWVWAGGRSSHSWTRVKYRCELVPASLGPAEAPAG